MEADFETHFRELTSRLKHTAIVLLVFSTLGWFASEQILQYIQSSLEVELHAVQVYEVIYARLNIAVIFGLAMTLPVLFYQLLQFAKPGLTKHEYTTLRDFLPLSFLLFILGSIFAYVFVISTALNFFHTRTVIAGITPIWGG